MTSLPQIFLASGVAIMVFVEASEMVGRSQIVKKLKNHGAAVCTSIQDSHFIIVDPETHSGRLIIHEWVHVPNKVVLDHSWVSKCIKAKRLLDESDDWGGCAAEGDTKSNTEHVPEDPEQSLPPSRLRVVNNRYNDGDRYSSQVTAESQNQTEPTRFASCRAPQPLHNAVECPIFSAPSFLATVFSRTPMPSIPIPQMNSGPFKISASHLPSAGLPLPATGLPLQFPMLPFNPILVQDPQASQAFLLALADQVQLYTQGASATAVTGNVPNQQNYQTSNSGHIKKSTSKNVTISDESANTINNPVTSLVEVYNRSASDFTKGRGMATTSAGISIFVDAGKPLRFFVQIDLRDRTKLVDMIKKHGGKITSKQDEADFSILSPRSNTYASLLKSSVAVETPAVGPSFVEDCVTESCLLDRTSYLLSNEGKGKKVKPEKVPVDVPVGISVKRKRKADAEEGVKKVERERARPMANLPYRRSPSPPPAYVSKRLDDGRYGYAREELEYAVRYAEMLLERDHEMSVSQIARKLHEKMPHHPVKSWTTTINQRNHYVRDNIAEARKRAGIAYRKACAQALSTNSHKSQEQELEADIQTVVNFLVYDDDGTEHPDVVWARLSSQMPCRAGGSWADFYNHHSEEVNRRYNKLKESRG